MASYQCPHDVWRDVIPHFPTSTCLPFAPSPPPSQVSDRWQAEEVHGAVCMTFTAHLALAW